ncbi:unnamed protein product, partial [Rotaria sp. Silwood1]
TVIDTNIVSPNGFEFYLNSHATIQGTSLPMFYQVLDNEIAFTSDDIQQLTYYLCQMMFDVQNPYLVQHQFIMQYF